MLVIPCFRVDVVLNKMMSLPMGPIGTTGLFIYKWVCCRVSCQVGNVSEGICLETIAPQLGIIVRPASPIFRKGPQLLTKETGVSIMQHVRPEEVLVVISNIETK